MIDLLNQPNQMDNKTLPNFRKDFESLLELIKEDKFSLELVEKIEPFMLELFQDKNYKIFTFWNRFDGSFKIVGSPTLESKDLKSFDHDALSWFPILVLKRSFLSERKLCELLGSKKNKMVTYGDLFPDNRKIFASFLKEKIQYLLISDYKNYSDSLVTKDYSYFYSRWKQYHGFPIDVLPKDKQFIEFWQNTELFKDDTDPWLEDVIYSKFLNGFLCRDMIADKGILFSDMETFTFRCHYESFLPKLIDFTFDLLNDMNYKVFNKLKLLRFLSNFQSEFPEKILGDYTDKGIFKKILFYDMKKLETVIYGGYISDQLSRQSFVYKSFESDEISEDFKLEEIKKALIGIIKKDYPAPHYEVLQQEDELLQIILDEGLITTDCFFSIDTLIRRASVIKLPIVYCPMFINDIGQISTMVSFRTHDKSLSSKPFESIEKVLIQSKAKTSEKVKGMVKSFLDSPFNFLSQAEKDHFNFVLSMETIE